MTLTPQSKRVLKLAADLLATFPIEDRHELWQGIADLTPEESEIGGLARMNAELTHRVITTQRDFLTLLAIETTAAN